MKTQKLERLYDQASSLRRVLEELAGAEDFEGPLLSEEEARQVLVEEYGSVEKMEQALSAIGSAALQSRSSLDMLCEYYGQKLRHAFTPGSDANTSRRWAGTHLIAEALGEARQLRLDDNSRCTLLTVLLNPIGTVLQRDAQDVGAVDALHAIIELLECTATAICDDEAVAQRFIDEFAALVGPSAPGSMNCLPIWCIGELTERGPGLEALARRMALAVLQMGPSTECLQTLRMVCERGSLREQPALQQFCQSVPLAEAQLRLNAVGEQVASSMMKDIDSDVRGLPQAATRLRTLLAEATAESATEMLFALGAARRALGKVSRRLEGNVAAERPFVDAICQCVVGQRPLLPVFVVAETLEAIRDVFPGHFARAAAALITLDDIPLAQGLVVCVVEGVEAEIANLTGAVLPPQFPLSDKAETKKGYTFAPGSWQSEFEPFFEQLTNDRLYWARQWTVGRLEPYRRIA